ncbi:MAG: polyphosphate polymerase domain-containing protein [Pirellula sp.]|jgi:hypothetical protein|nr:polyphosphate polymerase domain-containing protein [Pirellula sp.]
MSAESVASNDGDLFSKRYEIKFTVTPNLAAEIQDWALVNMGPDPFLADREEDSYRVTSLYLDTPQFGIFHRQPESENRKYRVRRYGDSSKVWLEVKRKKGDLVRKKRTWIDETAVPHLTELVDSSDEHEPENSDHWFRARVNRYELQPCTWIEYRRFARVHESTSLGARLTIDRDIRCLTARDWSVPNGLGAAAASITPNCQLELKFCNTLPALFKSLMNTFSLARSVLSKYRTSVNVCYLIVPKSAAS